MTAIRHTLQRQLFDNEDEKLYSVINVKKAFKKKNSSFLGLAISNLGPTTISIVQIKECDKNSYKIKRKWPLSDLKAVDGQALDDDSHELHLQLDKLYKWFTSNTHERQAFVKILWKYCCTYLPKQKPIFRNFPKQWLEDMASPSKEVGDKISEDDDFEEVGSYQAITESEEKNLERLMASCQSAVSNAESFMDGLAKELSFLDEKNVHSILSSEEKVEELMHKVEDAIVEADKVDARLAAYDNILSHVRDAMEDMEAKNLRIAVANKNNQTLLKELENIILQLDLPAKQQAILADVDLTTAKGLQDAVVAGNALIAAMNAEIHPALVRMQAVQDQRKRFEKCRNKFTQSILRHLSNLFISFGNDAGGTLSFDARELTLPSYKALRQDLEQYTPLMHWLKLMDRKAFGNLTAIYVDQLGKLYERDITAFFEEAKNRVSGGRDRRGKGSGSKEDLAGKLKQQAQNLGATARTPTPGNLLGIEKEQWCVEVDDGERSRFDQVFERALAQLEPFCLSEQNFCVSFFKLDVLSPTGKNTQTTLDAGADLMGEVESSPIVPARRIEKQINEEVRMMMGKLFRCLEPELTNFISYFEKLDGYYSMYVLVRLAQHVMSAQDTGSFLSMSFGTALVGVKRSFDKFMQAQLKSIEDCRPNRRSKCGILPFVENFKDFAQTAENIFQQTDRRDALDKYYLRLVAAMFEAIPRIGGEHPKTPLEVVKMENFHYIHDLFSQLKIQVLENSRKEAKQRYNEALKNYVTQYFGRPLEKLNLFFEGVEAKVQQGVKESEVSYQMAFSKEQLRKVISQYPAREVKKGLENLYRKVEKHLSDEVNLLQVVWRAMQNEFIHQYKHLEERMQQCYPGSMVTLEFSINDILEFFSEIARSH